MPSAVAAEYLGVDLPSSTNIEAFPRQVHPVVVGVHADQDPACLDLIGKHLRFVLRNTHPGDGANDATRSATCSGSGQGGNNRPGCYQPKSGNRDGSYGHQRRRGSAQDASRCGANRRALRGLGDTRTPMWCNLGGHWIVGLPLAYALCFERDWGVTGLWTGLAISLMLVGVSLLLVWRVRSRRMGERGQVLN